MALLQSKECCHPGTNKKILFLLLHYLFDSKPDQQFSLPNTTENRHGGSNKISCKTCVNKHTEPQRHRRRHCNSQSHFDNTMALVCSCMHNDTSAQWHFLMTLALIMHGITATFQSYFKMNSKNLSQHSECSFNVCSLWKRRLNHKIVIYRSIVNNLPSQSQSPRLNLPLYKMVALRRTD